MPIFKDPVVISGIITVGGMLLTFFLSQFFSFIQTKTKIKERFFYEVFPKRLAVYEDVIKELNIVISDGELPLNISARDMYRKFVDYPHSLTLLISRLAVYGSPGSERILHSLIFELRWLLKEEDIASDKLISDVTLGPHLRSIFFHAVRNTLSEFTNFVKEETGTYLVNKKLVEYIGQAGGKPKTHKSIRHEKDHPKNGIADQ
jgi:hypothetical protein